MKTTFFFLLVIPVGLLIAQYSPPSGGGGASFPSGTGAAASHGGSGALATAHDVAIPLTCIAASASHTTYTCSPSPAVTLAAGDMVWFQADVANTGTSTLNVNSGGAKTIKKQGGSANLAANDLLASQWVELTYDGTNFQMQGQLGNVPGGLVGSSTQVLSVAAPSITVSSIPATGTHLRIQFIGRSTASAQSENLNLTANGDGGANYNFEQMSATGTGTANANSNSNVSTPFIAAIPGASATSGSAASATIEVIGYSQTNFFKNFVSTFGWTDTSATPNHIQTLWVQWKNASAINSITLTEGSGANLIANSLVTVSVF